MVTTSIPLGLIFSQEGPYAAVGTTMFRGAQLAVSEIADDPDYGFFFDVQSVEPGGRNDGYVAGAQALLSRPGLTHVVGCYTSSSRKEVLPVFEKLDAVLWYPSHYEGFETSENIVYTGAAPNQHVVPLTHYILSEGGRRAFMVGSNYIWAWENNRIMREILGRNGGQVLGERYLPVGEVEVTEMVDLILRHRPNFIFSTLIGQSAYSFLRCLRRKCSDAGLEQPRDLPVLSCSLAEFELPLIGDACDGHISSSVYFSSLKSEANARFVAAWERQYPGAGRTSADAEASYIAVHMLARAIKRAGSADPAAVLQALSAVSFDAPQGMVRIDPDNRHCYLWPRIGRSRADGTFEILHDSSKMVRPDPYLVWEPLSLAAQAGEKMWSAPRKVVLPEVWLSSHLEDAGMPHKKHKPEEIVAKLRQVDVLVSQGQSVAEAVRSISVTQFTYYRWRKEFGGLKTDQVKRLKELEKENERLRKAVSDLTLEKLILREAASGNF